jgi:hypothetical protein
LGATYKKVLGCLVLTMVALLAAGLLAVLNWETVSERFSGFVGAQAERTRATLFRLGELASIGLELKREYGVEPDMAYETGTGVRVLSIVFGDYALPAGAPAEEHARAVAAFALEQTKLHERIDTVRVVFPTSDRSFPIDELRPAR